MKKPMYKVEIICRQQQFDSLRSAMNEIGVTAMTVYNVMGCGGDHEEKSYYHRDSENALHQHIKIETVICEVSVDSLLDKIQQVLKVGEIGEGKVFVSEICGVMRVRTGERDYDALQ